MKIFLVFQQSPLRYAISPYHFWAVYLRQGLAEAGHSVVEPEGTDWARGLLNLSPQEYAQWKDETWSRTLEAVRNAHQRKGVDLFLSYLFPCQIEESAVQAIRQLGIPCVNFFCDNVREYRRLPREFGSFDLHWVPEYQALALYREAGFNYVHAAMPCWVAPELRRSDHPEEQDVVFIGSKDYLRAALFAEAIACGIPIKIHGSGWLEHVQNNTAANRISFGRRLCNQIKFIHQQGLPAWWRKVTQIMMPPSLPAIPRSYLGGPVSDNDYIRLTQRSKVTVGVSRYPSFHHPRNQPPVYSRLRDIEAPMLGSCYLTEWNPDITHLYENGVEIETYENAHELAEKVRALLASPVRRKELRTAGQRRALNDHSVGRSVARIAERIGLQVST